MIYSFNYLIRLRITYIIDFIRIMVSTVMNNIESKLSQLKNRLESAAFLVSKENAAKEAHSEIVQALVILAELKSANIPTTSSSLSGNNQNLVTEANNESNEINKVGRRLNLWAKRKGQINSKILTAFLKLERSGESVITEDMLKAELSDESTFESNFAQMRTISDRNHGKVFDQYGDRITIWPPVVSVVRKYEKEVFEKV